MTIFNLEDDKPQIDPTKNYLDEYVGDGKKYKTVEELAKAYFHADSYIPIMEKRMDDFRKSEATLREQLNAGPRLQELIDQLKNPQTPPSNEDTLNMNGPEDKGLDLNKIDELVSKKIQERELTLKQQENERLVKAKLKERFGNNTEALKEQMESLGISQEFAADLARNNPQVFIRTFGLDQQRKANDVSPPRNQLASNFSAPNQERTWSWYEKLRKEQPKVYKDPKTAVQMQNDAIRLGEAFMDGDYNKFH